MNPSTLERAILAFCASAGLPRSHVSALPIGDHVAIWVRCAPTEPTDAAKWPHMREWIRRRFGRVHPVTVVEPRGISLTPHQQALMARMQAEMFRCEEETRKWEEENLEPGRDYILDSRSGLIEYRYADTMEKVVPKNA